MFLQCLWDKAVIPKHIKIKPNLGSTIDPHILTKVSMWVHLETIPVYSKMR